MLVRDRMSRNPITTYPAASVPDALQVMRGSKVRQLPVLNDKGELVGIVSLEDLLKFSPSPATSLSVYELNYLLEKLKVEEVMTRDVVTVTEDVALEEAGRIMADSKISGVPVMRDGELVGIITESHLFSVLVELFGARKPGVRLTLSVAEVQGTLAKITAAISALGGVFVAFGEIDEPAEGRFIATMKIQNVPREDLVKAVKPLVLAIEDVREI
jgi:acetoin utilization protein AcuB